MLVKIRSGETKLIIPVPAALAFNRFTACLLSKGLRRNGVDVTAAQAVRLMDAINRYRRTHPEWCLAEVRSAGGEMVMVKL